MAHATPVAVMQSPKNVEKDDKVSYERNTKMLLEEFSKNQSKDETIRTLMKLTFDQRRAEINSSTAHTTKIMKDYPFFKKKKWVSYYCCYRMWKELVAVGGHSTGGSSQRPGFDSRRLPGSFPHSLFSLCM